MLKVNKKIIDYSATSLFSTLFTDYINGLSKLNDFYVYRPEIESFSSIIKENDFSCNRELLVQALQEQYASTQLKSDAVDKNIQALNKPNTFSVCTGHQLCLFTGPLYFIYKIITTINLADQLNKKYPAYNFVPVYWMATEDHDFEEINHINLFGKKIEWKKETVANSGKETTGKLDTTTLDIVIAELKIVLGEEIHNLKLIEIFSNAYLNQKNLAEATRVLVHTLFSDKGLVIMDADDKRLKSQFTEIIEEDIFKHTAYQLVSASTEKLNSLGYKTQVHAREINLFYHSNNSRERIVQKGEVYEVLNSAKSFTPEELKKELKSNPEKFSTNVILRPLYQQKILPNIAYVGGPAEIAYWLQYKAMFDYFKVTFPVLIPRNSLMWLDEKIVKQVRNFSFKTIDLFDAYNKLINKYFYSDKQIELALEKEEIKLKELFHQIALKAEKTDKTLKPFVEAELTRSVNALKNISGKILKAEKQKQETTVNQIKKLKEKLFPGDIPQERYDNFIPYYMKYGDDFFKILYEIFNPFEMKFIVVEETS